MPVSDSTAIAIFMLWRTVHSGDATSARSSGGWLIWTPMNSAPATTAPRPAALVSWVVVIM